MPFKEQSRRDSWPPTIIHLDDSSAIDDIDEDPFPYFLTSPAPEDTGDETSCFEDLTAGIEAGNEAGTSVREVSPSAIQRAPFQAEGDSYSSKKNIKSFGISLGLRGLRLARELRKHNRVDGQRVDGLNVPTSTARGRNNIRLTSRRESRGRGKARSLSTPRAHSWREPSPEVYPIPEEREDAEPELTPQPSSDIHVQAEGPMSRKKDRAIDTKTEVKKTVRWALP
jgi:hypothetical protein